MTSNNDNQTDAQGPLDKELERMRQEEARDRQAVENILFSSLDTITSQQMEKGKRKKKQQARRLTDDTFDTVLILYQHVTPFDSRVIVSGFHSESYVHDVREFVRDRKETLGVRPTDFSPRVMKEKVKEYYDMSFRDGTGALQVIVGEFRVARD